jgi:UDP-glucose 4-epimerase
VTTVLVTGAGGYIGQRLTRRLTDDGIAVRALVRRDAPFPDGVEVVKGDLVENPALARSLTDGVDVAIHLAGANEVATAADPVGSLERTVLSAERIATSGVERIMYLSTIHVYGDAMQAGALVTEDTPTGPKHPYAASRLASEEVFIRSGVPALIFRLTNGVGAPTHPEVHRWSLVANELCREGALSGQLTLRTSGAQWRDFVALTDVESVVSSVVTPSTFVPGLFNLASGTSVTVRTLAGLIQDSFEAQGRDRPQLVAPPLPEGWPGPYQISTAKLSQLVPHAVTPLRSAVDETVRFCIDHQEALR